MVVAAPGRAREHLAAGTLRLDACAAVVLDEADLLLSARTLNPEEIALLLATSTPGLLWQHRAQLPSATFGALLAAQ